MWKATVRVVRRMRQRVWEWLCLWMLDYVANNPEQRYILRAAWLKSLRKERLLLDAIEEAAALVPLTRDDLGDDAERGEGMRDESHD